MTALPASNRAGRAVQAVLRTVLDSAGWERAFLVAAPEPGDLGPPRVQASASLRPDGRRAASRTVLRRALEGAGHLICADARDDPALAEGVSVRALDLRAVASVPVGADRPTAALVVDRRAAGGAASSDALRLLAAFAEVLAALCGSSGRTPAPVAEPAPVLIGRSARFLESLAWARRVARSRLPVLLVGETGTGKEGIARAIHRDSVRVSAPFLAVNCAALPETLLESELFGAVRGAYTGAERDRPGLFRLAHGGTLFLDEVGDMSPPMQAKLLRVLQDGRVRPVGGGTEVAVDVRIVSATHRNLGALAEEGRFRADLYWRLATAEVCVPPLRDRREDIPLLAEHIVSRLRVEAGTLEEVRLDPSALDALASCDWPGNVRQLQSVLARGLLRCEGDTLSAAHLDLPAARKRTGEERPVPLERRWIEEALRDSQGHLALAASRIGWSRQKLYRRMKALGLPRLGTG
ncbi:MAG: sigma 54-interacting transcriptional regulator [Acidobacteriia bacterium]|nr:sigma 54-interacting transcriptional regulator [Terriglobia bacterium]